MTILVVINEIKDIELLLKRAVEFDSDYTLEILYIYEDVFELSSLFLKDNIIDKVSIKREVKKTLLNLGYDRDVVVLVYEDDTKSHIEYVLKSQDYMIICKYNTATKDLYTTFNPIYYTRKSFYEYQNITITISLDSKDLDRINFIKERFSGAKIKLIYDYIYIETLPSVPDLYGDFATYFLADIEIDSKMLRQKREEFEKLLKLTSLEGVFLDDMLSYEGLIDSLKDSSDSLVALTYEYREIIEYIQNDFIFLK